MIEEIQTISEESGVPIEVVGRIFFKAKRLARRQRLTGPAYLQAVRKHLGHMVEGAKLAFIPVVEDAKVQKPARKRKSK